MLYIIDPGPMREDNGGQFLRIDWSHAPIKVIEAARRY